MINRQMIVYAIDDAGLYKAERLIFCTIMLVVRRANYSGAEGLFKQRVQCLSLIGGIVFALLTSGVSHPYKHNNNEDNDEDDCEFHINIFVSVTAIKIPAGSQLSQSYSIELHPHFRGRNAS